MLFRLQQTPLAVEQLYRWTYLTSKGCVLARFLACFLHAASGASTFADLSFLDLILQQHKQSKNVCWQGFWPASCMQFLLALHLLICRSAIVLQQYRSIDSSRSRGLPDQLVRIKQSLGTILPACCHEADSPLSGCLTRQDGCCCRKWRGLLDSCTAI